MEQLQLRKDLRAVLLDSDLGPWIENVRPLMTLDPWLSMENRRLIHAGPLALKSIKDTLLTDLVSRN